MASNFTWRVSVALATAILLAPTEISWAQKNRISGYAVAALESKVDTRTAKAGDPLKAKLLGPWMADGVVVPAGAKLLGSVESSAAGSLALVFDHYQVRRRASVAVRPRIYGVSKARYTQTQPPPLMWGSTNDFSPPTGVQNDAQDHSWPAPRAVAVRGSSLRGIALKRDGTSGGVMLTGAKDFKIGTGTWFSICACGVGCACGG